MLGNLTSYLTEKDWEEITKRIEACVERVLERHKNKTCFNDNGRSVCIRPTGHTGQHMSHSGIQWETGWKWPEK